MHVIIVNYLAYVRLEPFIGYLIELLLVHVGNGLLEELYVEQLLGVYFGVQTDCVRGYFYAFYFVQMRKILKVYYYYLEGL